MASLLSHLILQLLVLLGAVKAAGHEVEVLVAVEGLHSRVALVEAILPCYFVAAREVIYSLKPAQVTVDVRLYGARTPDQDDCIRIEEVAVALVCNVQEVYCWHSIILVRLPEALLLKDEPDQSILEVCELEL